MLGKETEMTTLSGELQFADGGGSSDAATATPDSIAVRFYVARVVHEGELVVVFGVAPLNQNNEAAVAALVEGVRMGEWGTKPGWKPPSPPTPPGNVTGPGSAFDRAPA
jgi:hypothetical protein